MQKKRNLTLLIFTLAVMAVLLRPFMAYQLSQSPQLAKDPVAVNSLLQRLIKKKDDHHNSGSSELLAVLYKEKRQLPPPGIRLPHRQPKPFAVFAYAWSSLPNTIFKICPAQRCYVLNAQYRI